MSIFILVLASVLTISVAQVLYALITVREGWYSTPTRYAVVILSVASSLGAVGFVLLDLMGMEGLPAALVFVGCQALAMTLRVGSGLRGIVRKGNLAEERAERLQESADEANKRLEIMQKFADGVRERLEVESAEIRKRLEAETAAIRERLEAHDSIKQSDLDEVKENLAAEQRKVREALGEAQADGIGVEALNRIKEMQKDRETDRPAEEADRKDGKGHRGKNMKEEYDKGYSQRESDERDDNNA